MIDKTNYTMHLKEDDLPMEKVGGKALNLSKLSAVGYNIPMAFIVSVEAYDYFIKEELESEIASILSSIDYNNENSIYIGSKLIKNLIKSKDLPKDLLNEIQDQIKNLPEGYYAVRSSALAEDLEDASFAGQLDSFLYVGKEDIIENLIECWASYWNDHAIKYRHDSSIGHLDTDLEAAGIAVLVQKMVNADVSGVTFTADPVYGTDDIVIESTYGLGEAIASGIVTPDTYVLDRHRNIKKQTIKTKKKGYFLLNGRNTLKDIDEVDGKKSSLNNAILLELADIGMELEKYFGVPQDIEWALEFNETSHDDKCTIYILQSRPVTTLTASSEKDDILWTRAYGDEYWADATTPLFYDVMGKMLTDYVNHEGAKIMGYTDLIDTKLLKLHKSRVYFNSWVLEKAFSYYPKFARSKELLNYFPLKDQQRISEYPTLIHKTLISQLLIAIRDPDGMMHKTDKAYKKWAKSFMEKCDYFDKVDFTSLTDAELLSLYKDIETSGIKHYQLIRYGMVSHSIATNLMIKNWLVKWLDDTNGTYYAALISGLKNNKTVEMNIKFSDLAKILREDKYLMSKIDSKKDLDSLTGAEIKDIIAFNSNFKTNFDLFIKDYGHRSNTREIFYPRWKEDEAYVLDVIKLLSSSDLNLRKKEEESRENRIQTEKLVIQRIKNQKLGLFKSKIFIKVLKLAQTYLTFRENQRFYLDHILFRQRLMLLEMGNRLVQRNVLSETNDVFFLYETEIMTNFQSDKSERSQLNESKLMDDISGRKKEFYRYKSILPPKFLKNGIEFDDTVMEYDENAVYGAAASPGIFKGKVRVVESIRELSKLEDNEILIASNTDPAWTAVFSKIGALITETGGILSHGAVISREYRIPAVTAVKGATELFKTGEEIVVDGNEGVVYKNKQELV
jgi:pyruvate,water dikinase